LSGVGNSVIVRFENGGINRPDPDKLARISRALGVSLNEVLAAGGVTSGVDLPTYGVYLRSRFSAIPEAEVEKIERYFARVANKYGIDPDGPLDGEDEQPQSTRSRRGR
jgi:transcriptional regulator with XRE-family HTH domain